MIPTSPAAALVYHRSAELVYHKSAESRPAAGRMNYRDTDPSLTSSILSQSKWMHLHCIQRDFMACKHASMHGQLDMPKQCLSSCAAYLRAGEAYRVSSMPLAMVCSRLLHPASINELRKATGAVHACQLLIVVQRRLKSHDSPALCALSGSWSRRCYS